MFYPGKRVDSVIRTLDTGQHLRYTRHAGQERQSIFVDSLYNLRNSSCTVASADGEVISNQHVEFLPTDQRFS